jgi:hypothetical protein
MQTITIPNTSAPPDTSDAAAELDLPDTSDAAAELDIDTYLPSPLPSLPPHWEQDDTHYVSYITMFTLLYYRFVCNGGLLYSRVEIDTKNKRVLDQIVANGDNAEMKYLSTNANSDLTGAYNRCASDIRSRNEGLTFIPIHEGLRWVSNQCVVVEHGKVVDGLTKLGALFADVFELIAAQLGIPVDSVLGASLIQHFGHNPQDFHMDNDIHARTLNITLVIRGNATEIMNGAFNMDADKYPDLWDGHLPQHGNTETWPGLVTKGSCDFGEIMVFDSLKPHRGTARKLNEGMRYMMFWYCSFRKFRRDNMFNMIANSFGVG